MRKTTFYINTFVLIFVLLCSACREVKDDELLRTPIVLDDGTWVQIIHWPDCPIKCVRRGEKTQYWNPNTEEIRYFIRLKNEVYCHTCIDSLHALLLNILTRANIRDQDEIYERYSFDVARNNDIESLRDSSDRMFEVYYSFKGQAYDGGSSSLMPLPKELQSSYHLLHLDEDYQQFLGVDIIDLLKD